MTRIQRRCITPLLLAAGLATMGCPGPRPSDEAAAIAPTYGCLPDGGALQIQFPSGEAPIVCPSFPNTTPSAQPQWDYFAWNSFIAANWPALDPATNNNQRGFPDLTKNFTTAGPGDLLVWETFKEKRELFQPFFDPTTGTYSENTTVDPGPWNPPPGSPVFNYGPLDASTNQPYAFPACTGSSGTTGPATRRLPSLGKLAVDGAADPNAFDETVEVASEALESPAALCQGHTDNPCGTSPADCTCVQGLAVGPRVWKGNPTQPNPQPVRYEVKANYDYYNYVQSNQYWQDALAASNAQQGNVNLPFRTSAASGTTNGPNQPPVAVLGYDAQGCIDTVYGKVTSSSRLTPCLAGSIQVKTAWIPLINGEDPSKFHTSTAAIFRTQPNPSNPQQKQTCIDYDSSVTYGLIGMHIIQRIHQGSGAGPAQPQGGTYVFATWEHVDNDDAGFTYANYLPPQTAQSVDNKPPVNFYPMPAYALPVKRQFPILSGTAEVNTAVWNAIRQINPDSVWLNYQLVGTQFQVIDLPTEQPAVPPFPTTLPPEDPTNIGQNVYLANSVVETNDGLQLFRGLPPNVPPSAVAQPYSGASLGGNSSPTAYARDQSNTVFSPLNQGPGKGIQGYTMGGCMGCHGVAQLKGYSFSFIFLEGQGGGDVDTEDEFNVPPLAPTDFTP